MKVKLPKTIHKTIELPATDNETITENATVQKMYEKLITVSGEQSATN